MHVAVPVLSVVPVHVSWPFSVNDTGSPGTGADVPASVRTAETSVGSAKSPLAGAAVSAVVTSELATVIDTVAVFESRLPSLASNVNESGPL